MKRVIFLLLALMIVLASCDNPETLTPTLEPGPTHETGQEAPAATDLPTPTATPAPEVTLNVCTAGLPSSLFLYNGVNTAIKQNLLSLIYEPAFEKMDERLESGILEKVPALADGDLRLEPVSVQPGQTVVDAYGNLVSFKAGVRLRPSGCRESACAVEWDGESPFEMDQMVVDFKIREGVTWSDGTPLKSADSVFSFTLASSREAPGLKWAEDRTDSFIAQGDQVMQWRGRPGFTTAQLDLFFWTPLPSHLFSGEQPFSALQDAESLTQPRLGYGPFVLESWDADQVSLTRNPYYDQNPEGLPLIDRVIFKVIPGGQGSAWEAMQAGECDVLDTSFGIENEPELLAEIQRDQVANVTVTPRQDWTQLAFGIQPASYDEYYNPTYGDRPDIFGDPLTRKAIAACIDRAAMVNTLGEGLGVLWSSFISPEQSMLSVEEGISYDPQEGARLLQEVGWLDADNNPQTPLEAWGVANVPNGTRFTVDLLTNTSGLQRDLGRLIQADLSECGIQVNLMALPPVELYAAGPEGPFFGRDFDLALIAWQPLQTSDCGYYQGWMIPSAGNNWIGTNIAGFSDQAYDNLCSDAQLALPGELPGKQGLAEQGFIENLPAIPLISGGEVLVISNNVCLGNPVSSEDDFFHELEYYQIQDLCP